MRSVEFFLSTCQRRANMVGQESVFHPIVFFVSSASCASRLQGLLPEDGTQNYVGGIQTRKKVAGPVLRYRYDEKHPRTLVLSVLQRAGGAQVHVTALIISVVAGNAKKQLPV